MPPGATDPRCVYVSEVNGGSVSSSAPSDEVWEFAESVIERRRSADVQGRGESVEVSLSQLSLSAEKEAIEIPPELLQSIFEMAACGESDKATGASLLRVCKIAHEWYVLYAMYR